MIKILFKNLIKFNQLNKKIIMYQNNIKETHLAH
jgi:hypothetical protein